MILFKIITYLIKLIKEFLYVWAIRLLHLNKFIEINFDKKFSEYKVISRKKDLNETNLENGISGFYRVKNEEKLLEKSVESHIEYLDEVIIVYNNCTDNTSEIALRLQAKYPHKIKVFHYEPIVYPPNSIGQILATTKSVYGLANYYNFTLSKISKKIAVKIDGDHICIRDNFKKAVDKIRNDGLNTMKYFYGLNILIKSKKIFINKQKPFTYGFDCGFFPLSEKTYFVQRQKCETLRLPFKFYLTRVSAGVLFYHIKYTNDTEEKETQNLINWEEAKKLYLDKLKDVTEIKSI